MDRRRFLYGAGAVGTALLAGCNAPQEEEDSTPTPTQTEASTPTPSPTPTAETPFHSPATPIAELPSSGIQCDDSLSLSFWGLNDARFWTQDSVRVGYSLPPNTSVILVTYIDGSVSGVTYRNVTTSSGGVNADGDMLQLDTRLTGKHVVRTVVHHDQNDDGQFEPGTDLPCLVDGEVVEAGPVEIDFSQVGEQ